MFSGDADDRDDLLTHARAEQQPGCTAETPVVTASFGQRGCVGDHRVRAGERGGELSNDMWLFPQRFRQGCVHVCSSMVVGDRMGRSILCGITFNPMRRHRI